jgi:hypothetical protein
VLSAALASVSLSPRPSQSLSDSPPSSSRVIITHGPAPKIPPAQPHRVLIKNTGHGHVILHHLDNPDSSMTYRSPPMDLENTLPLNHFLSLERPDVAVGPPIGVVDTTTLAAHDFDVDMRTGFMPPQPPLTRLPTYYEPWEVILEDAIHRKLQLGDKIGLLASDAASSEAWRARVRQVLSQRLRYILPLTPSIAGYHTYDRSQEIRSHSSSCPPGPCPHFTFLHSLPPPKRTGLHSPTSYHPPPSSLRTAPVTSSSNLR